MSVAIVVNGRFLRARPTGLHRAASSLLDAALDLGLEAEVVVPPGVDRPELPTVTVGRGGGPGADHRWEQVTLPRHAGGRLVASLANTSPVVARRSFVVVHDLAPLVGPHWFRPAMRAYGLAVLAGARRAERVATDSVQVADELRAAGVRAPIALVRPAVDPGFVRPAPEEVVGAVAAHGLDDEPYVVVVGWADPRKDTTTAALAHLVARRRRPHRLALLGLPHRNFAPVAVPEARSIKPIGYVDDATLRALLAGAAALVYPSRYEGFGLPPLEAWACGTPAIVGDTPAVRESTEGRATYVAPGDVSALADAIVAAVDGQLDVPALPSWTWHDAARQLLAALP